MLWPRRVQMLVNAEAEGLRKFGNYVDLIFIRDTDKSQYRAKINYKK